MHDDDDNGRDRNGRWKKGYCPNLKGRPRKKAPISESDVYVFKQTMVDAVIGGRPTKISRAALLLHKMFEGALKGSVLIQRKLFERFEQSDDTVAEGEFHLRRLGDQITEQYNTTGTFDERLYDEYRQLYALLKGHEHHEAVAQRRPRDRRKPAIAVPRLIAICATSFRLPDDATPIRLRRGSFHHVGRHRTSPGRLRKHWVVQETPFRIASLMSETSYHQVRQEFLGGLDHRSQA